MARVLEAHIAMYLPPYKWIIGSTKEFMLRVEKTQLLYSPHFVTADVEQFYIIVDLGIAKRKLQAVMKDNPHIQGILSVSEAIRSVDFVNSSTYFTNVDVTY